ncbi:hypothetical protein TNCT_207541 [Trichonephila clavata]|uniref:Uncharacterized protein n=1 Tax=Trichonephila clavata TaxID=2740835 RepID=A0A8X6GWL6_TRICU|nr:hypothetical protein TNCT_207541 [Trichonephila clavata]
MCNFLFTIHCLLGRSFYANRGKATLNRKIERKECFPTAPRSRGVIRGQPLEASVETSLSLLSLFLLRARFSWHVRPLLEPSLPPLPTQLCFLRVEQSKEGILGGSRVVKAPDKFSKPQRNRE